MHRLAYPADVAAAGGIAAVLMLLLLLLLKAAGRGSSAGPGWAGPGCTLAL